MLEPQRKVIGDTLTGLAVSSLRLRKGVLEITFEGGLVLMAYVPGYPMVLKLLTPNGIIEDGE